MLQKNFQEKAVEFSCSSLIYMNGGNQYSIEMGSAQLLPCFKAFSRVNGF